MREITPGQPFQSFERVQRFYDALRDAQPSGGGGCHPALLRVANLGRHARLSREHVMQAMLAHSYQGTRKITDREILDAVNKAFNSLSAFTPHARMRPFVDGAKLLEAILKRGAAFDEKKLGQASPVRIDWPPERDGTEVLTRLYARGDQLFIGARHDAGTEHVRPVSEWIDRFERGVAIPEHIIPNPLTGEQGLTKDGKESFRADSCVAKFWLAVGEFDDMPLEKQIQFWAGAPLPVVALIDSGGKSIHGWIPIDATDANEWTRRVEQKLFDLLVPCGVDSTCKNEARLSRMPGHFRNEKKHWQRVLYLNPAGGPVIP